MEGLSPSTIEIASSHTHMFGVLAVLAQERFGKLAPLLNLTAECVQRRIILYVAQICNPAAARTEAWRVIGKIYDTPNQMERSFECMQRLWANGFSRAANDHIGIPEPFRAWPDLRMLLMEEVPGVRLRHLIKDMEAGREHMRLLAGAAAKLHRCPSVPGPPMKIERLLSSCRPRPQRLAQKVPALAAPINYVVETGSRIEQGFGGDIYTPIHGDFHLAHVLVENEKCWLIDLDELSCADPAIDLAEMFVFFKRTAQKKKLADYINLRRDEFISHYGSTMGWEVAGREPLYESLLNLKRACKCFRVQDETGWEEKMRLLVEQAVACMQVMERSPGKFDFDSVIERYERCPGAV